MSVRTAPVALPADHPRVLRTLGGVGIGAGFLFAAMSLWQHAADSGSGPTGIGHALDQGGFAVAMVGYVALALGVHVSRPGGDGRIARLCTALLAAAWTAFVASMAIEAVTTVDPAADVLGPIAGLGQGIGLVGLGVLTVRARRWSSWRRFWPLALAAAYVSVLFVPAIAGSEPNVLTETVWALGYSGLGLALMAEQGIGRRPYAFGGAVGTALLAAAVVVTVTVSASPAAAPVAPETPSGTLRHEGPAGSVDSVPNRPQDSIHGSADALERQLESSH